MAHSKQFKSTLCCLWLLSSLVFVVDLYPSFHRPSTRFQAQVPIYCRDALQTPLSLHAGIVFFQAMDFEHHKFIILHSSWLWSCCIEFWCWWFIKFQTNFRLPGIHENIDGQINCCFKKLQRKCMLRYTVQFIISTRCWALSINYFHQTTVEKQLLWSILHSVIVVAEDCCTL